MHKCKRDARCGFVATVDAVVVLLVPPVGLGQVHPHLRIVSPISDGRAAKPFLGSPGDSARHSLNYLSSPADDVGLGSCGGLTEPRANKTCLNAGGERES